MVSIKDKIITPHVPEIKLYILEEDALFFSTLLQAGIYLQVAPQTPLDDFLCNYAGFSRQYIEKEVQTIFINGQAVDDLKTPLYGQSPVVAISAAMPGLAGAIFRKNSAHASLRTVYDKDQPEIRTIKKNTVVNITLKLFNTILRDKGAAMLQAGVEISSSALLYFIQKRPEVMKMVRKIVMDRQIFNSEELLYQIENILR